MEDAIGVSREAFEDLLQVGTLLKADVVSLTRALGEVARLSNVELDVPALFESGRREALREALARAEGTDEALAGRLRSYLFEERIE